MPCGTQDECNDSEQANSGRGCVSRNRRRWLKPGDTCYGGRFEPNQRIWHEEETGLQKNDVPRLIRCKVSARVEGAGETHAFCSCTCLTWCRSGSRLPHEQCWRLVVAYRISRSSLSTALLTLLSYRSHRQYHIQAQVLPEYTVTRLRWKTLKARTPTFQMPPGPPSVPPLELND